MTVEKYNKPFLNHLAKLWRLVDRGIVHCDHRVWLQKLFHIAEERFNETIEFNSSVGLVLDCEMQNPIK